MKFFDRLKQFIHREAKPTTAEVAANAAQEVRDALDAIPVYPLNVRTEPRHPAFTQIIETCGHDVCTAPRTAPRKRSAAVPSFIVARRTNV